MSVCFASQTYYWLRDLVCHRIRLMRQKRKKLKRTLRCNKLMNIGLDFTPWTEERRLREEKLKAEIEKKVREREEHGSDH